MQYILVSNFNERVKELYSKSGLSQQDFAEKIGITKSLFNRYLNRGDNAKADKIIQIANSLNVNPLWLIGCDVPMSTKDLIHNIPLVESITYNENIFSVKNIKTMCTNVIDLDIDYQYYYFLLNSEMLLIRIQNVYKNDDAVIAVNEANKVLKNYYKKIDLTEYKVLGHVVSTIKK